MTTVKVQKNQIIAKQKEKVKKWYIVQEGTVIQCNSYAKIVLGKNAVIGISEGDRYLCDYVATEDSVLAVFNCESAEDLKEAIHGQESMRSILLRAALGQRQMLLRTYAGFTNLVRQFHSFAENEYSQYENLCAQYHLDEQSFTRMDNFKPLEMVHRAENWEIGNSASLTGSYLEEYVHLMQRDDNLCIGAIMEASYQTRRVTQGIIEMVEYLRYNQDILLAESKNDLFNLFFALAIQAQKKNYDVKPLLNEMDRIAEVIKKLGIYSGKLVDMRMEEYRGYHFETEGAAYETPQAQDGEEEEPQEERSEDCPGSYPDLCGYRAERHRGDAEACAEVPGSAGYVFHGRADVCNPQADHTDFLRYLLKSVYAYRKGGKRAYPDCGNVFEFRIYGCADGRRGECQYSV